MTSTSSSTCWSTSRASQQTYEEAIGVTYDAAREDADEALHVIVERFGQLSDRFDVILVLGSDYTDVSTGTELSFNAKIAANLGSPVVLVVHGREPDARNRSGPPPTSAHRRAARPPRPHRSR